MITSNAHKAARKKKQITLTPMFTNPDENHFKDVDRALNRMVGFAIAAAAVAIITGALLVTLFYQ